MTEQIQFGAPVSQEPAPLAPEAQPPAPTTAEQPPIQEIAADAEGAVKDAEELEPEAEQAAEAFVHTHQSVLTDLLTNLEGIVHLGKSEIIAVVDKARALAAQL